MTEHPGEQSGSDDEAAVEPQVEPEVEAEFGPEFGPTAYPDDNADDELGPNDVAGDDASGDEVTADLGEDDVAEHERFRPANDIAPHERVQSDKGHPLVEETMARLDELRDRPVPDHAEVYAELHERLQAALVEADAEPGDRG